MPIGGDLFSKFIDNQPMIELITKKPYGVLPMLDDELIVPDGSDKGFLAKLNKQHKNNKVFGKTSKVKMSNRKFPIPLICRYYFSSHPVRSGPLF